MTSATNVTDFLPVYKLVGTCSSILFLILFSNCRGSYCEQDVICCYSTRLNHKMQVWKLLGDAIWLRVTLSLATFQNLFLSRLESDQEQFMRIQHAIGITPLSWDIHWPQFVAFCQAQPQLKLKLWLRLALFFNSSSHPPTRPKKYFKSLNFNYNFG